MRAAGLVLLILLCAGAVCGQSVSITGPQRHAMLEDEAYEITWQSSGVESVSLVAHGERTPLGSRSRGDFDVVIAENVPASLGSVVWAVPWIDSIAFFIKAKGYDADGLLIASDERGYGFRPAVLAARTQDGIYLDLHQRKNQRLYVQRNGRLARVYMSSSSAAYDWRPASVHLSAPHDHAGVYRVLSKTPSHWSRLFQVEMPYAMRYAGGHFIHATKVEYYPYLGGPASSGCNRMTLEDARELYHMSPIGTRVEVIGPDG